MGLLWLLLCLTYCGLACSQQHDEATVLDRDLQDFVRRLTHSQMQTPQDPRSPYPLRNHPLLREESGNKEALPPMAPMHFPIQSNVDGPGVRSFASSYASASAKRPFDDPTAQAKAVAYSSVRDVNREENLEENIETSEKISTLSVSHVSSPAQGKTTLGSSAETAGPYTLKHQQTVEMKEEESFSDVYFVAIVAGCCAVGIFGVISAGFCFYRLQKSRKAAADVDYPAYGVTGPCKDTTSPNGDRKLAQSAQMYHYQHQKQQMIAVEKAGSTKNTSASDVDSEEENEEGDYTVYECPGLAPTGEMEVKNPLFHDDSTPVSPPVIPTKNDIQSN